MTPDLHLEVLPKAQKKLWDFFCEQASNLNALGYYLAGGTALALQLGHRRSNDFDFFSRKKGTATRVHAWLSGNVSPVFRESDADTVHLDLRGVKVSFIGGYGYPLVGPAVRVGTLHLASVLDVAVMKLLAITHRAALRDYLDLAAVFQHRIPLQHLLKAAHRKYGRRFNAMIPLRALVSFDDVVSDEEKPTLLDHSLGRTWQSILKTAVQETAWGASHGP